MNCPVRPRPDDYHLLIQDSWKDIFHSRVQEWSALGVVVGAHIGILELMRIAHGVSQFRFLAVCGCIFGFMFTAFGGLITMRHRRLMMVKLFWISVAENKFGLIQTEGKPRNGAVITLEDGWDQKPPK